MTYSRFNETKTAQAAAYLLYKAGGTMHHLKLMKLLYLADRLSWQENDYPITGDDYYSLPYGPVLSKTLDLMHGETLSQLKGANANAWDKWIKSDENYSVKLAKAVDESDEYFWDYLSINDEEILTQIFDEFGHFETFALVEYTHNKNYVPEWENPKGSSKKIDLRTLLQHIGKTPQEIEYIFEDMELKAAFDRAFKEV
ncbi:Panacea domain-containing protein [Avibacterium avium]|uniref:Panacea domain-containing protein n=1 Tax=Avibacterium avium TaxID=751 RepID=UPI003BF78B6D